MYSTWSVAAVNTGVTIWLCRCVGATASVVATPQQIGHWCSLCISVWSVEDVSGDQGMDPPHLFLCIPLAPQPCSNDVTGGDGNCSVLSLGPVNRKVRHWTKLSLCMWVAALEIRDRAPYSRYRRICTVYRFSVVPDFSSPYARQRLGGSLGVTEEIWWLKSSKCFTTTKSNGCLLLFLL